MTKEEKHKRHLQNLEIVMSELQNDSNFQNWIGGKSEEEVVEACRKLREEVWEEEFAHLYRH